MAIQFSVSAAFPSLSFGLATGRDLAAFLVCQRFLRDSQSCCVIVVLEGILLFPPLFLPDSRTACKNVHVDVVSICQDNINR